MCVGDFGREEIFEFMGSIKSQTLYIFIQKL